MYASNEITGDLPSSGQSLLLRGLLRQQTGLLDEAVDYYSLPFNNSGPGIGHNEPPIGSEIANTSAPRYFNYRKASIYAGSNEIQRNIMAKLVLELT